MTDLSRLALAVADRIDPPPPTARPYWSDPAGWARDMIRWPTGEHLADYQAGILDDLVAHGRVAARGPHGLGKTTTKALAIIWYALTRDGLDWKIPTTASVWRQLEQFLWPEVHKWARLVDWDRFAALPIIGRGPLVEGRELLDLKLKLRTGEAFAAASNDPGKLEGAHADHLLYVFDEAKIIPAETFDAAEGAFSGADPARGRYAYAIAASTPGEPAGRFYEIHQRRPGLEDWHTRHITLDQAVAAGRVAADWADSRARQWGRQSAVYLNRVAGEFAASDEDGVIPMAWLELAHERWADEHRDCWPGDRDRPARHAGCDLAPLTATGVDVARSGSDDTVLAMRHGWTIGELRRYSKAETTETTGRVKGVLEAHGGRAVVDVIGIGAGVYDQLREHDLAAEAFNASEGTKRKDRSGEFGFVNVRAAAWWHLRELLDPDEGEPLAIPDDPELTGDLLAPHWKVMSGARIQIESKDDIRKRLGRSPDAGDAVVQAFWEGSSPARLLVSKRRLAKPDPTRRGAGGGRRLSTAPRR